MTAKRNVGASVRDRLLRMAQQRGENFQHLLSRYANERLLHRLSRSPHADLFVLEGATLFSVWSGSPHRATRDIDLLGFGDPGQIRIRQVVEDLAALEVEDDGVELDASSIVAAPIREDQEYGGVRVLLVAQIAGARVRCQIDVGFGDAITPAPVMAELPALLEFAAPRLRTYPRETVVAEKLDAAVQLGMANSRMKDFYDLIVLARGFEFAGATLVRAIRATFERRGTRLPEASPIALTAEFAEDAGKRQQWTAFIKKADIADAPPLTDAIAAVARFALPSLTAAAEPGEWIATWPPGGPWVPTA